MLDIWFPWKLNCYEMSLPTSISPLEAHVGYWLRFVSNHVSSAFARRVEAEGVSVAEWVLLRELLDLEAVAPSVLAERMDMTRGAISKVVDRLSAKNLVRRESDKQDGRSQRVLLTPEGHALVPRLAQLADENDTEFFGSLSEGERQSLIAVLRGIVATRGLRTPPTE